MAEVGYAYVPASCAAQQPCRVHIALHGCKQNFQTIQTRYIEHAGYNEWADSNHIVVLYPQTAVGDPRTDFGAPLNPFGCWDWWGYTNFNYAVKAGRQIATIKAMLDRVTSGHAPNRPSNMTAPTGLIVNDVSDTGIAVAWGPLAHAQQYTLARADGVDSDFTPIGSVAQPPSFGDMGLRPATPYRYRVTVKLNDGTETPISPTLTAKTLSVPTRCDTPDPLHCAVNDDERTIAIVNWAATLPSNPRRISAPARTRCWTSCAARSGGRVTEVPIGTLSQF